MSRHAVDDQIYDFPVAGLSDCAPLLRNSQTDYGNSCKHVSIDFSDPTSTAPPSIDCGKKLIVIRHSFVQLFLRYGSEERRGFVGIGKELENRMLVEQFKDEAHKRRNSGFCTHIRSVDKLG